MDFKEELKKYADIVNKELDKYTNNNNCPEYLLNESMKYSLMAGGKRLRPVLILASYRLFREDIEKAYKYAVAMEMVHTFSLIHDDLPAIDNDDYRRGNLTNHKKYNEATAILAGDSLLNKAYNILIEDVSESVDEAEKSRKTQAIYEFSYGIDRMIAGEYVDTEYEGKQISSEYLEYMHENKTGALMKAACQMGCICGGGSEAQVQAAGNYGLALGLAFQMIDDILDVTATSEQLGKPAGSDAEEQKQTFVTILGIEKTKAEAAVLTEQACAELDKFPDSEITEFLRVLANAMLVRIQ